MHTQPFVPVDFILPEALEAQNFRLRMLTVNDLVKDYDAVMSSAEHLKQTGFGGDWPTGLTLEQNLIDLGWHQKEFQNRTSFAFTVVDLDESRIIGCIYIYPTLKDGYDAVVVLWTRPPEQVDYINEDILRKTIKDWLKSDWPFQSPAYPGGELSWEAFDQLAEKS